MARQLSFLNRQQDAQQVLDCLRYEEIQDLWRTTLPADDDIDWCAKHVRNCSTAAHGLTPSELHPSDGLNQPARLDHAGIVNDDQGDVESHADAVAHLVRRLLEETNAIQSGEFDYGLPCGRHSDTHVDAARLCWSDSTIDRAAELIGRALRSLAFDTLVSTSWPMAVIARRIARRTQRRLEHVAAEGYIPMLLGPIQPGSQVVILTDVVVSGQLTRRIQAEVQQRAGRVVKCVALTTPEATPDATLAGVEPLCRIPMALSAPDLCPRCGHLPLKEFNALASQLTLRKERPRSSADFLAENREAAELWQLVERTGAYERHHREGHRHYVAFVDTLKLLSDPEISKCLVAQLWDRISCRMHVPDVLLVPSRARARLLSSRLLDELKLGPNQARPQLVFAHRQGARRKLPDDVTLDSRSVLVLDAAADHGDTIDELTLLARAAGASRVGAAVLLSRLRAGSAEALDARLNGGFSHLLTLPIAGFRSSCVICDRYEAWRSSAHHLPPGPTRDLVLRLTQRAMRRRGGARTATTQLKLFGDHPLPAELLLLRCHRRVAGGIALHALHAAQGDGMAPLSVAELFDNRLPLNNRIGLVEALPTGILKRTGPVLKTELERYLRAGDEPRLWLTIADVFIREGQSEWVDGLGHALRRQAPWLAHERFWTRLSAVSVQARHTRQPQIQSRLETLLREFTATPIESKLRELRAVAQP